LPSNGGAGGQAIRRFDFVNAIRGRGRPSVTGEDGIKSLALALAASKSIATRTTVRL
jgi:predicted dehydrogenase